MPREVDVTATLAEPAAIVMTAEEYDALPPQPKTELLDGVLYPMTPPTLAHQRAVSRLERAVEECCPDRYFVAREQELRLGDLHRRSPDLLVVDITREELYGFRYPAGDVLVAVEVVSPTTEIVDRVHKPIEYADAGVPHYWRMEIRPDVFLRTCARDDTGRYRETGTFRPGEPTDIPGLPWARFTVPTLDRRP